jgi:FemAB-related protein (PEP-CTERM system-associated)
VAREFHVLPLDGIAGSWDEFVAQAEGGSFCHLAGWRDILSDVLGTECLYWAATDSNGAWQAILPLVRVKSWMFGHYLVSLPFLNYGGPLGSPAARRRLVQEAVAEARRSRVDLLELRTRQGEDVGLPVCARKITVLLELPPSSEQLWQESFSAKLRTKIRRVHKERMEMRFGPDQLDAFYDVFARNMRDLGTPVLPRQFFERIATVFRDRVLFGAVYWERQPVAAGCGFMWRDEFEMTWSSGVRQHGHRRPNLLLYSCFLEYLIERGVRVFNFGRSTPGSGPHEFKRQWGGRDVPLPWCQYASGARAAPPSPDDPAFSWGPRLWRWLPLPIANRLGPRIIRFLP